MVGLGVVMSPASGLPFGMVYRSVVSDVKLMEKLWSSKAVPFTDPLPVPANVNVTGVAPAAATRKSAAKLELMILNGKPPGDKYACATEVSSTGQLASLRPTRSGVELPQGWGGDWYFYRVEIAFGVRQTLTPNTLLAGGKLAY